MTERPRASRALERFTVLDLTRARAGPTAVRQLADWGCDVIKIEMPEAPGTTGGLGGPRLRLRIVTRPAHRDADLLVRQVRHHLGIAEVAQVRPDHFYLRFGSRKAFIVDRIGVAAQVRQGHWEDIGRPVEQ